ncbi:MAG: hypothetical protein ACTSUD_10850 [Alphaproteobacteria bacterium]
MSISAIAKGLATFVVPASWYNRSQGRTLSARYCYSVYLRHLVKLHQAGADTDPQSIAEIGPGASIGTGLAALIAGAERYYGFDIKAYGSSPRSLAVFDELAALFSQTAPIPGEDEFPRIKPALDSLAFPSHILTPTRLKRCLADTRLAHLRRALSQEAMAGADPAVAYVAPWFDDGLVRPASIDWIFSQAVMEHVDQIAATYRACFVWLKPGAAMSHQVDFKSHGTSQAWNGHWAYSDLAWRAVRGARLYLISRAPHSVHREALEQAGFELLADLRVERQDGLPRERLARRFRALDGSDLRTAGAFMIAHRPA